MFKNRYIGISQSGKSYNFKTSMNGGKFFSIPISSVIKIDFEYNDSKDIYVEFNDWVMDIPAYSNNLESAIKLFSVE